MSRALVMVARGLLMVSLALGPNLPALAQPQADAMGLPASDVATTCGSDLPAKSRRLTRSPRHDIAFVMQPAPAVGRHFGLDIVVCPRGDASAPLAVRVNADMPAHRHGMNYLPTVRTLGNGRYRAEGLLFHMPGRWRLLFDLSADGRLDRLSHEMNLE